jgi:hypothetical protein
MSILHSPGSLLLLVVTYAYFYPAYTLEDKGWPIHLAIGHA